MSRLVFSVVLLASIAHAQNEETRYWSVKQLVEFHLATTQYLGVQDIYKMLYQANFGNEHLMDDTAAARTFLNRELESLPPATKEEELLERISCDGAIVRVNLRPYSASGYSPELLFQAMLLSAAESRPDTFMFRRQWNEFAGLVRYGLLRFPLHEVQALSSRIDANLITPLHHSKEYEEGNRPAYRVVRRKIIQASVATEYETLD